jgi:hypothetical protein
MQQVAQSHWHTQVLLRLLTHMSLLRMPQAIKEGRNRFNFLGQDIRLIPSCAICVTMNPGYAGRNSRAAAPALA